MLGLWGTLDWTESLKKRQPTHDSTILLEMFGQMTSVGHSFSQMESDLVCAGVLWEEEEWEERVLWEMVKNREAQYFPIHASWHTGGQEIAQGKCCRTYTHFIQLVSTSLSTLCVCVCFPVTVTHLGFDLHPTVVGVFLSSWVQLKVKKEKKCCCSSVSVRFTRSTVEDAVLIPSLNLALFKQNRTQSSTKLQGWGHSPWHPCNLFSWLEKERKGHSHGNSYC